MNSNPCLVSKPLLFYILKVGNLVNQSTVYNLLLLQRDYFYRSSFGRTYLLFIFVCYFMKTTCATPSNNF